MSNPLDDWNRRNAPDPYAPPPGSTVARVLRERQRAEKERIEADAAVEFEAVVDHGGLKAAEDQRIRDRTAELARLNGQVQEADAPSRPRRTARPSTGELLAERYRNGG